MGTKLFSRSGNSYTPTFAGRKYMEYTRKILQIQQDWEKELKDLDEEYLYGSSDHDLFFSKIS